MTPDIRTVPLSSVVPNPVALRAVDRENEQYQNLSRDVGRRGILQPITVREKQDAATGETYFELCDGLQRFSAATDNGLPEITVSVKTLDDAEVEELQIVANLCRVDTKPIEYTKQLMRMMQRNPTMTETELAEMISQSTAFVRSRLGLLKLDESIQALVNDGEIGLANAYALSKLPREEQHNWTDSAITQAPSEFVQAVNARAKEIKDAAREGRQAGAPTFTPTAKGRKLVVLTAEHENPSVGPALCEQVGVTTAAEGFALAIAYCCTLDPVSVQEQEAKWNAAQAEKKEAAAKRAAAREERRRRDAEEKAAKAREDAGVDDEELERLVREQEAADAERRAAREAAKAEGEGSEESVDAEAVTA